MSYRNYQKLTRRQARQRYNKGEEIYFHPSRMSWNNPWQNPMPAKKDFEDEKSRKEFYQKCTDNNWHDLVNGKPRPFIEQFEMHVSHYSYYNCCRERGLRVIFLVQNK